jgi:hypothetical protein
LTLTGEVQAIVGAVGQTVGEAASVAACEPTDKSTCKSFSESFSQAACVVLSTFNADFEFLFNLSFLYKNKAAVTMQAKIVTQTETMMTMTVVFHFYLISHTILVEHLRNFHYFGFSVTIVSLHVKFFLFLTF